MNNLFNNIRFGEDIESQADQMLLSDDEYLARSTPLKSMQEIKGQHRRHIVESLKMVELEACLNRAAKLIREELSSTVSTDECDMVLKELNECDNIFEEFTESLKNRDEKPVLLQEKCGFSNNTLTDIYKLAHHLVENKQYTETMDLLIFLIVLNPVISIFWRSLGLCLQEIDQREEAAAILKMADALNVEETNL